MSKIEAITAVATKYGFDFETPTRTIKTKAGEEYPEKVFTHSDVFNWKLLKKNRHPSVDFVIEE